MGMKAPEQIATIEVGTNIRTWITYRIDNPTPEELAILEGDKEAAIELAAQMLDEDRLTEEVRRQDDCASIFEDHDEPSIISITKKGGNS